MQVKCETALWRDEGGGVIDSIHLFSQTKQKSFAISWNSTKFSIFCRFVSSSTSGFVSSHFLLAHKPTTNKETNPRPRALASDDFMPAHSQQLLLSPGGRGSVPKLGYVSIWIIVYYYFFSVIFFFFLLCILCVWWFAYMGLSLTPFYLSFSFSSACCLIRLMCRFYVLIGWKFDFVDEKIEAFPLFLQN